MFWLQHVMCVVFAPPIVHMVPFHLTVLGVLLVTLRRGFSRHVSVVAREKRLLQQLDFHEYLLSTADTSLRCIAGARRVSIQRRTPQGPHTPGPQHCRPLRPGSPWRLRCHPPPLPGARVSAHCPGLVASLICLPCSGASTTFCGPHAGLLTCHLRCNGMHKTSSSMKRACVAWALHTDSGPHCSNNNISLRTRIS